MINAFKSYDTEGFGSECLYIQYMITRLRSEVISEHVCITIFVETFKYLLYPSDSH